MLARQLLWIDALGGLGVGLVVLVLHDVLAPLYRLPDSLVVGLGIVNLAYGSYSFSLALTPTRRRPAAIAVLSVANMAWGIVCWWLFATHVDTASALGLVTLATEGVYVPWLGLIEWWYRRELAATNDGRGPQWSLLECRVPPPVVSLLVAAIMRALAHAWPGGLATTWRPTGVVLAVGGVGLAVWAIASFRRAATTIHPLVPHEATTLVVAGPNRWSRNPMYVGMLLVLTGWGLWLGGGLAMLGVPLAWVWLRRFQVEPEERALRQRFGAAYDAYTVRVRRWI